MASSSRKDYEIISDPFDPRCVVACFIRLQRQTDKEKLLLERIRGKEDSTSQKYTDQEERSLINEQISKSQESIAAYNIREGTSFEFVEVEKANLYRNKGYIYFITFVAKDLCDQTKVFQAKVCNVFCREIEHSFCRLKPGQQVECKEDSKRVVKKPRYNTRSNKRACRCH
ncbi:PREDICTED: uncharacterized protein LOC106332709 isoform X7 [Brassica oleracea var. oleracea]|uniref:uncharacterized protein LOC106332709 isoform X7 n=1 Tax=Brassica oleracea var. oleracea TaxID=109376 RepID=UPI0006A734B1|nr:PREDICTED: uncharacterized protein LOC106332709 isoform X7 [Brassica oleracea var. oleracea]